MATAGTIVVVMDAKTATFQKAVAKAASKLQGLDPVAKATGKAVKKLEKDTGGLASALSAAAAAAAAFGAVWKGFDMADNANGAQQAARVFRGLGGDVDDLRKSVGGMVSDAELIRKANLAQTMGINNKAFKALAKGAQAAAAKTGQSFDFMFDSIITGTARQSKLILDNLGIMVDMGKVSAQAKKLVASGAAATMDAAKAQAFQNEVMLASAQMVKEVVESGANLTSQFSKVKASFQNAGDSVGRIMVPAFEMLLRVLIPVLDKVGTFGNAWDDMNPKVKAVVTGLIAFSIVGAVVIGTIGAIAAALAAIGGAVGAVGALQGIAAALGATGAASAGGAASVGVFGKMLASVSKAALVARTPLSSVGAALTSVAARFKIAGVAALSFSKTMATSALVNSIVVLVRLVLAVEAVAMGFARAGKAALGMGLRAAAAFAPALVAVGAFLLMLGALILLAGSITIAFERTGTDMTAVWADVGQFISNTVRGFLLDIQIAWIQVKKGAVAAFGIAKDAAARFMSFLADKLGALITGIRAVAKFVKDALIDMWTLPMRAGVKFLELISGAASGMLKMAAAAGRFIGIDTAGLEDAASTIETTTANISRFTTQGVAKLKKVTDAEVFLPAALSAAKALGSKAVEIGRHVGEGAKFVIVESAKDIGKGLKWGGEAAAFVLKESGKDVAEFIRFGLSESVEGVKIMGKGLAQGLGIGGKDAAGEIKGAFAGDPAGLLGRLKGVFSGLGIDMDPSAFLDKLKGFKLFGFREEQKKVGKTVGDEAGKSLSEAAQKALADLGDDLAKRTAELVRAEEINASAFPELTTAALEARDDLTFFADAAKKLGVNTDKQAGLVGRAFGRTAAEFVNGAKDLDDFNRRVAGASEAAEAAGVALGDTFTENLALPDMDLAGLLTGRVGEAVDAFSEKFGQELSGSERGTLVTNVSQALAQAFQGGFDPELIGKIVGQMFGQTDIGGDLFGDLFGGGGESVTTESAATAATEANTLAVQSNAAAMDAASTSANGATNGLDSVSSAAAQAASNLRSIPGGGAPDELKIPGMDALAGGGGDLAGSASDLSSAAGALEGAVPALGATAAPAAGAAASAAGGTTGAVAGATGAAVGATGGAVGAAGGTAVGASAGSLGGPAGIAVGAVVGIVAGIVLPKLIEAFGTVASGIKQMAGIIPNAVEGMAKKLAGFAGDSRLTDSLGAMQIGAFGTAFALAAVAAVLTVVFMPALLVLAIIATFVGGVLLQLALIIGAIVAVMLPSLIVLAALVTIVLLIVAAINAFLMSIGVAVAGIIALAILVVAMLNPAFLALAAVAAIIVGVAMLVVGAFLAIVAVILGTIMGALGLFALSMKTDSFKDFQSAMEGSIDRVVEALEPFWQNLMALVGLFDALMDVVIVMANAFGETEGIARMLFEAFKIVAIGLSVFMFAIGIFVNGVLAAVAGLANGIAFVIDGIANAPMHLMNMMLTAQGMLLEAMAGFFENIPGFGDFAEELSDAAGDAFDAVETPEASTLGDALRDIANEALGMSPNMEEMGQAIVDLTNLTFDEAAARGDALKKEKEISESMTNIPAGFKVVAARFRAIAAEEFDGRVPGAEETGGGGGGNFFVELIEVVVSEGKDVVDQIEGDLRNRALQSGLFQGFNDGQDDGQGR